MILLQPLCPKQELHRSSKSTAQHTLRVQPLYPQPFLPLHLHGKNTNETPSPATIQRNASRSSAMHHRSAAIGVQQCRHAAAAAAAFCNVFVKDREA
mmetsp:Transcript_27702/g.74936  ORF Transcript_27702/g.74936 Transcript_27702/m.74936 type:complete len:97 (+) Transcript_27702:685-975(+)|eukprot:1150968-Pelagomonas_calceolata.AAC.3